MPKEYRDLKNINFQRPAHLEALRDYQKLCQECNWKVAWVELVEALLQHGYYVTMYDSRSTCSKYIYVSEKKNQIGFKIRVSDHHASKRNIKYQPSDFYVGKGVNGKPYQSWQQALNAVHRHFNRM